MKITYRSKRKLAALILSGMTGMSLVASAGQYLWTGAGSSTDWSDPLNWNQSAVPKAADTIRFTEVGLVSDSKTTNNRVSGDFSTTSLSYYRYDSPGWHVTEIAEDATLTLKGAAANTYILHVGAWASTQTSAKTTQAAITGKGRLVIDQSTANIQVSGTPNQPNLSVLDLSGLSRFQADVHHIEFGVGIKATGILRLAEENTLTAHRLTVGFSNGNTGNNLPDVPASELVLGESNLFHIDEILIGASPDATRNTSSGKVHFASGLADAKITLRGATGENSAVRMVVGGTGGSGAGGRTQGGTADFTGGEIDAILSQLVIAHSVQSGGTASQLNGEFSMDRGTVTADEVTVALSEGSVTATSALTYGKLSVAGGNFTAGTLALAVNPSVGQSLEGVVAISGGTFSVTGTHSATQDAILLGVRDALSPSVKASIVISGGLLSVTGGNINTGVGTQVESSITLSGGTLDLDGHQITVDLLTLQSGRLLDLGEFNTRATEGATLAKVTTGVMTIGGLNTYSGSTDVREGTLLLEEGAELRNTSGVRVRGGATFGGIGSVGSDIMVEELGTIALTLSPAPADAFRVTGAITLGANTNLELTLQEAPMAGNLFRLIEVNGGQAIDGAFSTLNGEAFLPGDTFNLSFNEIDYTFRLIYGDGSDLHGYHLLAQAIPEPSGIAFIAIGMATLGLCRYRSVRVRMRQS